MLQETFAGALVGQPELGFADLKANKELLAAAVAIGAGFVGLISLFNIGGRFAWASSSDKLGRQRTYVIFFLLGIALYLLAAWAASVKSLPVFVACFCVIASMYGGGFATIPAYLADMFGTQFVGAIHGRLLTAWSTAFSAASTSAVVAPTRTGAGRGGTRRGPWRTDLSNAV